MLTLTLLGQVAVARDGKPISHFRSQAEIALLVYLAHTARPHSRETVADLLWNARSTEQSLSNLRTVLTRLREHAGDEPIVTRKTVALRPEALEGVDSTRLRFVLQEAVASTTGSPISPAEAARLAAALRLYRGDFLAGFYLSGAPRFNEWVVVEGEHLRQQVIAALGQLTAYALERPAPPLGIEAAQQWLAIDELNEVAHARLIHLLALDGRASAALAHYDRLVALLDAELGVEPQPATVALMERVRRGEITPIASSTPAAMPASAGTPAPAAMRHNLRRELTPFIGRDAERVALVARLLDPAYPLVTLAGEGGMGKTRLALAAARDIVAGAGAVFPDGVWFVPLAALTGRGSAADEVAASIRGALGLSFHGERRASEQLTALLRARSCLIVLDNFEHLLDGDAPDLIIDLLAGAPGVQLLVTSRAPLDLNSEFVVRLAGLRVPVDPSSGEPAIAAGPVDVADYDSARLFAERAARAGETFRLADSAADVAAICRYLAGAPLGIELAAAWVGRLSPADIAAAIATNLDFLASRRRDVPERQRSMRAVFEYSWGLLGPAAQRALAGASVFRGGFDRAAAEAVIEDDAGEIDRLAAHSLLARDGAGRYSLHELLREFAAEKLTEASGPDALCHTLERHGVYYLNLVGDVTAAGEGAEASVAAARADVGNIRAAWRWAITGPHPGALAAGWQGLWTFYNRRSLFQEGEEAFSSAIAALRADAPALDEGPLPARLQLARGSFLNLLNRYDEAVAAAAEVLDYATTHDDVELLARGHLLWGTALFRQGHFDEAPARLNRGLLSARLAGPASVEADIRWRVGSTLLETGDTDRGREELEAALAIYRELNIRQGEAEVLVTLGWLEQRIMRLEAARERLTAGLAIHRELDNRHGASMALINLAVVIELKGDFATALAYRLEALDILETIDDRYHRSLVNHGLGVQLSRLGDYEAARPYYERSIAIDRETGDEAGVAWTQNNLGLLYDHLGEFETALTLHEEALATARELGARTIEGLALSRLGQDLHGLGRLDASRAALEAAADIQRELRQAVWAIESNAGLAAVCLDLGQTERAMALAEALLPDLNAESLRGAREPFRAYWNVYCVLAAGHDPRAAGLLAAAADDLRRGADSIEAAALRRSFLENVPAHRQILEESGIRNEERALNF